MRFKKTHSPSRDKHMLKQTITQIKRLAATGTISVFAGGIASAGWLCNWDVQHERPFYNPSCEPNWGFHETNWRRIQSMGHGAQGSYCPDGSCQTGMNDMSYQGQINPGVPQQMMAIPQQMIQPAPNGQAIILHEQPQQYQHMPMQDQLRYSSPAEAGNVFTPPVMPTQPQQMQSYQYPSQQVSPSMDMNMNIPQTNDYQHVSPGYSSSPGAPMPMMGGADNSAPTSTLNPIPSPAPSGGHSGMVPMPAPMPMQDLPMPMPPMPNQTSYQTLPANTVSQSSQYYGNAAQYPVQQRYAPNPSRTPETQYQQVPARGISYSRTVPGPAPTAMPNYNSMPPVESAEPPAKRFSLIPRFLSRGN